MIVLVFTPVLVMSIQSGSLEFGWFIIFGSFFGLIGLIVIVFTPVKDEEYNSQFLSRVVGPIFKDMGENVIYEPDKHLSLEAAKDADLVFDGGWKEVVGSGYTKGRFQGIDVEFSYVGYDSGQSLMFVFDRQTDVGEGFAMRFERNKESAWMIKKYIKKGRGIKELDKYAVFKGSKKDLDSYLTEEKATATLKMLKKRGHLDPLYMAVRNHKLYSMMKTNPKVGYSLQPRISQPLSEYKLPEEVTTAIDDAISLAKDLSKGDKEMEMAW